MEGKFEMKKIISTAILIVTFISSCTSEATIPIATYTPITSETTTQTPSTTATPRPTSTPIPPTATFSPINAVPYSPSPFTLTESNAGTEMKLLNTIGTGTAYDLKFSPDGNLLAISTGRGIFLYDGTTFQQIKFIEMISPVTAIAFNPNGKSLAIAMEGKASVLDLDSGRNVITLDGELVSIYKLVYGAGGHIAAIGGTCQGCGSPQSGVILWDAKTGQQIFYQKDIWFTTIALEFTPDGKQLLFGRGGIVAIETETGKEIASYGTGKDLISAAIDAPYNVVINGDGTSLFVSSYEEANEVFDLINQTRNSFPLCGIYITGNGEIGACSKDQKILIFDLQNGNELKSIDTDIDASSLYDMFVLSPDSKFLAYYGKTGINVMDLSTKEKLTEIGLTDFGIVETGIIEIDGVERYVAATLTYSGEVEIYDLQTGESIRKLKSYCCEIKGFSFAPDRKTFATIEENLLEFWDLQTGNSINKMELGIDYSGPVAFSPDGSHIFLTELIEDHIAQLDLQSGTIIKQGQNAYPYSYADPFAVNNYNFNYLGNFIKLGFQKNDQKTHPSFEDVKTGEKIVLPVEIISDPDYIETFSFSSDGQYLAYGNLSGIFVWNIKNLKVQSFFKGHERRGADGWQGNIRSLSFNPQSNLLISVGWDGTIRLWNARFGTELRRLNVCCSAKFSPDGRYLVTYGNGVAYIWGIP